jgi:predicted transcriptional regulator
MEKIKLYDGELKLMELLWERDGATAKELALLASDKIGWNKNTTYTVIKKLVAKGAIERSEPDFVCRSLITREDVEGMKQKKYSVRFLEALPKRFFLPLCLTELFLQKKPMNSEGSSMSTHGRSEADARRGFLSHFEHEPCILLHILPHYCCCSFLSR